MARTINNTSPYKLFEGKKGELSNFLRRCRSCVRDTITEHNETPECVIVDVLLRSINDRRERWESEWVELVKGIPSCLCHTPRAKPKEVKK